MPQRFARLSVIFRDVRSACQVGISPASSGRPSAFAALAFGAAIVAMCSKPGFGSIYNTIMGESCDAQMELIAGADWVDFTLGAKDLENEATRSTSPWAKASSEDYKQVCEVKLPSETADVQELRERIECLRTQLALGPGSYEEAVDLLTQVRRIINSAQKDADADVRWGNMKVRWARSTHGVLQRRCKELGAEIRALHRTKPATGLPESALKVLQALRGLAVPFHEARTSLEQATKALSSRAASGDWDAGEEVFELEGLLGKARDALLDVVREARILAVALPQRHEQVRKALSCNPELLVELEELALQEVQVDKGADPKFALGRYWSEISVSKSDAPFFIRHRPTSKWVDGPGKWRVPYFMARAEALMMQGEKASLGAEKSDRGASRALRLYQHAQFLALGHYDGAAEWRYRVSAALAALHQREQLAAHSFTRLALFLSLHRREKEALGAAGEALKLAPEPVAKLLQVTLRRKLGELRTDEEVRIAEKTLIEIHGKIPLRTLEEQRATTVAELAVWRKVTDNGKFSTCLEFVDAARTLICVIGRLAFSS